MTGRRRHPRYLLSTPLEGQLRVREEVTIESWEDDQVAVLSTVPSRPQERLTLELPGDEGAGVSATVQESRPVITADGSIRHRLRLSIEAAAVAAADSSNGDRKIP